MIKRVRLLLNIIITTFSILICLIASIYVISFFLGPPALMGQQNTIYFAESGEVIGEESGTQNRRWVELEQISPYALDAMIAIEDKNFYDHNGFDLKGIIRAAWANLKSLSLKEGASTITQQYARNLFLSHEKTWKRKIKEAFYTVRLEMYYSKDEILEGYLNTIYFGHGAYGIEKASRYFFGKNSADLTIAEASMLVAIPKGPTYYSPLNNLQNAEKRQTQILNALLDQQKISQESYNIALQEELVYKKQTLVNSQHIGPYFFDTVLKESEEILQLDQSTIKSGGFHIYTTFDLEMQRTLDHQIKEQVDESSDIQIAAIAMDHNSGAIRGLVGGRDYQSSPFNRAISAKRMPGSTFKPFLYYAALENNYTASTALLSKPTNFVLENNEVYQPSNFNGYYADDPITLAQALALSDNVYAVKTNLFLGTDLLKETARKLGIQSDLPSVPSLALGTASVSVKEMVTAYGILANGGHEITGHTINKIVDRHGIVVYEKKNKNPKKILDEKNAFILTHLLTGMFDENLNGYMNVTGSSIANKLTRPYAGKSGTTRYDSWMIGYSPSIVTGIWTGYDDNQPMQIVKETAYAKDIWATFMESVHRERPVEDFSVPSGVINAPIDPETGLVSTPYCPASRQMYFKKGTEPKSYCTKHMPDDVQDLPKQDYKSDQGIIQRLFELFM